MCIKYFLIFVCLKLTNKFKFIDLSELKIKLFEAWHTSLFIYEIIQKLIIEQNNYDF